MIEGELVNLRAYEMDDVDREWRWFNDREVTRYLSRRYPFSRASEEAWMREHTAKPMSWGNVLFAIEAKDGTRIGNISLHDDMRAENRSARLGIAIGDKSYWSRGYGSDAITTLIRFGFDEMNLHRVDLSVDADNGRAIACYRKCGFTEEARLRQQRYTRGEYSDQLVMGILRDEFRGGPARLARADSRR